MDIKHNRAETNGVRLHYITAGSGPIVLCLPGSHALSFDVRDGVLEDRFYFVVSLPQCEPSR